MAKLLYKYRSKKPLNRLKFKVENGQLISEELELRMTVISKTGQSENGILNFSLETSGYYSFGDGSDLIEMDITGVTGKVKKVLKTIIVATDFDADSDDIDDYKFSVDVIIHVTVNDSDGLRYSSRPDIGYYDWSPQLN